MQFDAALKENPSPDNDVRPSLDDTPALVDWLLRRYFVSRWDNDLVERLEMVLKRDRDGNLLPEGKVFRTERRGVTVTAASQDGKTTTVVQVMKRLFNDSCSIPDDHIDPRRSALFMARSVLREARDGDRTC